MVHGVHAGHHRRAAPGRADVGGGLFAADVLLACLQGQPVGRLPWLSTLTTRRPGMERLYSSRQAMKAACGPPAPMGMPKRWVVPTTMSAPMFAGR